MGAARPTGEFTNGEILRWRRVGGLLLAEVSYAPAARIPPDANQHARFLLILAGTIEHPIDGGMLAHRAGTLLFRPAHQRHGYDAGPAGATVLAVDLAPEWIDRAEQHACVLTRSSAFDAGFVLHLAQRLHGEFGMRDEVSRLAIESLVLGLLAEAARRARRSEAPAPPAWLERARALVDARLAEPLTLAKVAALVGVHPVHLARTFRRVYRTTFAAYVRGRRIEYARHELAGTAPLSAIAALAGFADQSHFSRLFKLHTGLTPSEYRFAVQAR